GFAGIHGSPPERSNTHAQAWPRQDTSLTGACGSRDNLAGIATMECKPGKAEGRTGDLKRRRQNRIPGCAPLTRATRLRSGPLEDGGDAHATGGADRDQAATGTLFREHLRERRDDPRTGRRERVAGREARSVDVEFRGVDRTERLVEAEPVPAIVGRFPRAQRAQHLGRERLV